MTLYHIDFETASECDLPARGLYHYARHPSTRITRMAWATTEGEPSLWLPTDGLCPLVIKEESGRGPGDVILAWNAEFEREIWQQVGVPRYGFPKVRDDQFLDSALFARACALPGGLGKASSAPWFKFKKDAAGHRLMMRLCKPGADGRIPQETFAETVRMNRYCQQDVRTERAMTYWCGDPLPDKAKEQVIPMDRRMNARGFGIDLDLLSALEDLSADAAEEISAEFHALTGCKVTELAQFKRWLRERWPEGYEEGAKLGREELVELLDHEDIPPEVERALVLRQQGSKSSLAKLSVARNNMKVLPGRQTVVLTRDVDGIEEHVYPHTPSNCARLVNQFVLFGAGQTLRYSARCWQPQNIIRDVLPEEDVFLLLTRDKEKLLDPKYGYSSMTEVLSRALRLLIVPGPGKVLVGGDYSQIEARLVAWLAGQDDVVADFEAGRDVYTTTGERIRSTRQAGKTTVLACGFQGGYRALQKMARNYGLSFSEGEARKLVGAWRAANPRVVETWGAFERAAKIAARRGRAEVEGVAAPVSYEKDGCGRDILWGVMPSGYRLAYHQPRLVAGPYGDRLECLSWRYGAWRQQGLYGGYLFQNCVQHLAADIMMSAMVECENAGLLPVMTIHDEIICEAKHLTHDKIVCPRLMKACMINRRPAWAAELPLDTAPWVGDRYQKG